MNKHRDKPPVDEVGASPDSSRHLPGGVRRNRNVVRPETTVVDEAGVHFSEAAAALLFDKMRTGNVQSSDAEWRVITHGDPAAGGRVLEALSEDLRKKILKV